MPQNQVFTRWVHYDIYLKTLNILTLKFLASECRMRCLIFFLNGHRLEFYSLIDLKINPRLCLDMTYPPAKFDVDWSKETLVIVKKVWCLPGHPPHHRHPQQYNWQQIVRICYVAISQEDDTFWDLTSNVERGNCKAFGALIFRDVQDK